MTLEVDRAELTDEEHAFIEAVTTQAAVALENVRLLEKNQSQAGYERLLSDISRKARQLHGSGYDLTSYYQRTGAGIGSYGWGNPFRNPCWRRRGAVVIPNLTDPTIQYLAWILALVTSTLALYILTLNWKDPTNRLISLLLAVVGVNQAAGGLLIGAGNITDAYIPTILLAITTLMILPLMVIVTPRLLKQEWLKERWRWAEIAQWSVTFLAVLPGILTLVDILSGTHLVKGAPLYYSGLDPETYLGGFIPFAKYTGGLVAPVLKGINLITLFFLLVVFYLYVAIVDKKTTRSTKILAWIVFFVMGVSGTIQIALRSLIPNSFGPLLTIFLFALVYGYASFHQMISEHQLQRGNLRVRLTVLVLVVTAPLLFAVVLSITSLKTSQQASLAIGLVGLLLLSGVVWLTVRQSLYPVRSLIDTASAISDGNLSREAPVESIDELGFLAETLNRMTRQLRELISSLEERVAEHTADLERRSNQLKAATLVSKEAAGIRDVHQMLTQTVHLISSYFDFYHVGIFILDEIREYAVLQAANSEGGQRMLARGHKLRVGQVGIVGYVADVGMPRIALDVGEDAIFFNNPDLPLTRSEMALPLKARGQVIGVLDVQSIEEAAFTDDDIETLQVLADQVALALDNARLLKESRDALEELRILYGQRTRQAWRERLERGALSYRYSRTGLISGGDLPGAGNLAEDEDMGIVTEPVLRTKDGQHEMLVPITLRGQVLGSLVLRREKDQKPWSHAELEMAMDLIAQVLPALENARLLEEIQNRAQVESLVGQVSSRIQSSLDLETVLKTAVQEIGMVVNATRVQIRLENGEEGVRQVDGEFQDGSTSGEPA